MQLETISDIREYSKFIFNLYRDDEFFKDNKTGLLSVVCGAKSPFRNNSVQKMVAVRESGRTLCQVVFIIHKNSSELMSFAFFEALSGQQEAVLILIDNALEFAKSHSASKIVFGLDGHCNNSVGYALESQGFPSFGESYNKAYYSDYFKDFSAVKFVSFYDDIANVNSQVNKDLLVLNRQISRSINMQTISTTKEEQLQTESMKTTLEKQLRTDSINTTKEEKPRTDNINTTKEEQLQTESIELHKIENCNETNTNHDNQNYNMQTANIKINDSNKIDIGFMEKYFSDTLNVSLEKSDFGINGFKETMRRYTDLNNCIFINHRYYFKRDYEEDYDLFNSMRPLLKNENLIFAKRNGVDVGFMLWYPDFNCYVPKGKGAGISTFLKYRILKISPSIAKVVEIGLVDSERNSGLILMLFAKAIFYANKYKGIKKVTSGWILDENTPSKNITKRYTKNLNKEFVTYEKVV